MQMGIDFYWAKGILLPDAFRWDFCILKATEGQSYREDPWYGYQVGAIKDIPAIAMQAYHYAHPGRNRPEEEARYFLRIVQGASRKPDTLCYASGRKAAVWLDLENKHRLSSNELGTWINTWCQVVEEGGFPVGLYTSRRYIGQAKVQSRPDRTARPIWVARYGKNDGKPQGDPRAKLPLEWDSWDVWQFTSHHQLRPGVYVDANLAAYEKEGV